MALTQKMLKAMGIEDDQREQILDAHQETLDSIKKERDTYKAEAEKVPNLQRQLEDAQAASKSGGEWEQKFNDERKAFEDFKATIAAEKEEAAKAQAYREMLAKAEIDPRRIDAIMRLTDLSGVEMEDGKLKDPDGLSERAKQEWSDFVVKQSAQTPPPATPPKQTGSVEGADPDIAKRLQARHERLYGKQTTEEKE